jgi:cobalt/nickel transport system ATP-binding protein
MIDIRGVSFTYEDGDALSGIDLQIPRGESVAIIGPNGSGKSTLLKLINGLVLPSRGSYTFDGEEITARALKNQAFAKLFHKRIGFLFQNADTQLFCPTVYDEVAFGPRQMALDETAVHARVTDCLTLLGIEHLRLRAPYRVSEGEKRKVAFASVVSLNPEVVVLDEPMNGLDPKTKRFMREMIVSLHAAGKTIVCSTHDFAYVEEIFARAVVIGQSHSIVRDDSYGAVLADTGFLMDQNIL